MTLSALAATIPHLSLLTSCGTSSEITTCYTGDLLSDVLANAPAGSLLITVQAHMNTIAVAAEKHLPAIIFCNSRTPSPDVIAFAESRDIVLFSTDRNQFETASAICRFLPNAV